MMKKRTGLSTAQRKLLLMWVMCGSLLLGAACGTMCTLFHPTCKMTQLLQAPNAFLLPETGAAIIPRDMRSTVRASAEVTTPSPSTSPRRLYSAVRTG